MRERADLVLVSRGIFETRARARAAIEAGLVQIGGRLVSKPAELVESDAEIKAEAAFPWVSRGGVKLAHALDVFGVSPLERDCLDVGASTGGFTDVLLSKGAARVVAVDTGRGQLHGKVASDPRVVSFEATDIRASDPLGSFALIVVDVSFISLMYVIPVLAAHARPEADLILLVKPQFEVGRANISKGGIVRDAAERQAALSRIEDALPNCGWRHIASTESPISGGDGNLEFLVHARAEGFDL
jgi:23S rRNA (cytidine1920-2'-O)/16S rRNA (cytidine1409-2'-O)-methyltransferase